MWCKPSCASVGIQVNTPVVLCIVAPDGGLVIPYVRLLAGVSVSVAVTLNFRVDISYTVWFDMAPKVGGLGVILTTTLSKYMFCCNSTVQVSEVCK